MAGSKLRTQCVSIPDKTVLVTCFRNEQLIGHAFASVWDFEHGKSTSTLARYRIPIFSEVMSGGLLNLSLIRDSASVILRHSSCKLLRRILSSEKSQLLGWFRLTLLHAMPWRNTPVSQSLHPYQILDFESDGLSRSQYICC